MVEGRQVARSFALAALARTCILSLVSVAILAFQVHPVSAGVRRAFHFSETYILSIGINDYPPQSGFIRLQFAESDASSLPPALAKFLGSLPESSGKSHIVTLLGSDATVDAIHKAMRQIASEATPNDRFIFNFDGMGICRATHLSYDFAAYDSQALPDGTIHNGLSARDLGTMLVQIPANNQYVILDSCGSHKALDDLHAALQPQGGDSTLFSRQVRLLAPDGSSLETREARHGLLTAALLDGLAGGADADHSGLMTWDRLVGYVTWKLPESTQGVEHLYTVVLHSDAAIPAPPTRALLQEPDDAPASANPNDQGQDYAFLVGTDHYPGGWRNLNNPIFDVTSLHEELVRDYGFRNDPDHIMELHDASKHEVEAAVEKLLIKKFGPRDRLLVYFAGHGYRTPIEGYIVFSNSKLPTSEDATDSMMAFSLLSNALDKVQVPHLLLVMDVCYGGLFDGKTRNGATRFQSLLGANAADSAPRGELIRRALEARSRLYITSGDEDHQVGDGEPGQHSPFSRRFLALLKQNRNAQPFLDIATLYNGLRSLPREPKAGYFYAGLAEQGGDYIFIPQPQSASPSHATPTGAE